MNFGSEIARRGYVDVEMSDSDPELRTGHCGAARGAGAVLRAASRGTALVVVAGLLGMVVVRSAPPRSKGSSSAPAPAPVAPSGVVELVGLDGPAGEAASESLKPLELLHDGNVCDTREELFGGLCYKTCALLTEGQATIRTSSWTCCKGHPCTPFNEMGSMGSAPLCKGYDVSGDGSCPHKPGACLVDEELYLGVCYKKCGLLTEGAFPNRVGPATCCKTKGLGCLNFQNDKTDRAFAVGGGKGDHDAATPATAHLPQKSLTEASESSAPAPLPETTPSPAAQAVSEQAPAPEPQPNGQLRPQEHMNDGNVCADDEELFGGLCYGKCSVLTKGEAPIRTSSWTCCEQHPCGLTNQRGSMGTSILCNGYDVSADGSCPHKPGACLVNEEMHLGVCYEKCSLLTKGEFPNRIAAATCCKVKGLGCLNFKNVMTSNTFDKGGGAGNPDTATLADAHSPSTSLTEQAGSSGDAASSAGAQEERSGDAAEGSVQVVQQPARWSFTSSDAITSVERKLRSKVV
mmetsp:Transcript_100949/g.254367  ORF Transcript_100949/g.254367 Transcript_100949/m.254367 type:complete len:518 (+) Transcript_100949:64-1617(+)